MNAAQSVLSPAGPQAQAVFVLWLVLFVACALVFVAVMAALVLALRRAPKAAPGTAPDLSSLDSREPAVVRRVGAVTTVRLAGLCATVGALGVVLTRNIVTVVGGFALIGVGIAVVVPLVFATAGRIGVHPGRSIAGVAGIAYGSGLIAPGIIGGIAAASSLTMSFGLVVLLTAAIAAGAGALRPAGQSRS